MMKCPYCGNALDLDDNFCSHCGKLNEQVRQHVEDMQRYNEAFSETKEEVYETATRYKRTSVRVVIIAILVILNVVMAIVSGQAYSIVRDMKRRDSEKHYDEYSAIMNEHLVNGEFLEFQAFVNNHAIDYFDSKYESYQQVILVTNQYGWIYRYIMNTVSFEGEETRLANLQYVADSFENYYEWRNYDFTYNESVKNELYQKAMEDMDKQVEGLLITYCGLTEEEAANFETYTKYQRGVLLEEAVKNGK